MTTKTLRVQTATGFTTKNAPLLNAELDDTLIGLSEDTALKVNRAGDTLTGKLTFFPSSAAAASVNLSDGVAPTTPTNGDIWASSGIVNYRVGGTTKTFLLNDSTFSGTINNAIFTNNTIGTGNIWNGNAVGAIYGGTGQTTYTAGDILYASGTNALSKLSIGANGTYLGVSGGVLSYQALPGPTLASDNTNTTQYLVFGAGTGSQSLKIDDTTTPLTYNPSTNTIGASISGNAATATTATNQSGGTVSATTISSSGLATLNSLSVTTAGSISQFSVSGAGSTLTLSPATAGTLNNVVIGGTTAAAGSFTTLSATGAVTLNGSGNKLTVSGTGSTLTISPATTGTIDSVNIGATTPGTAVFTTLSATGAATLNGTGNKLTVSGTGSTLSINPATTGTINSVNIGATTPGTGVFTTLAATGTTDLTTVNATGSASLTRYNLLAQTISVSGATSIDLAVANYFQGTATANATISFNNPAASGRFVDFLFELTNGGNFTITWPASVKWPNGTAPTLTTNGVDVLAFITDDGGTTWRGVLSMKDSK